MRERKKILITVKTYPQPSLSHRETVCTAGISEDGSLIRLYPLPYRMMESGEQFAKYQWVIVDVEKSTKDPRPESYKAFPSTISLGDVVKDWSARKELLKSLTLQDTCYLNTLFGKDQSLAFVKPKKVQELVVEKDSDNWTKKQELALRAKWLFGPDVKPLEKVPFKFKYRYLCADPHCNGHEQQIEDWEIFTLYRKMFEKYGNSTTAVMKVQEKFYDGLCSDKTDLHFFLGMHSKHRVWMIIGLFYPPNLFPASKAGQKTLWSV